MATTLICGFEMHSVGVAFSVVGTPTISTTIFRSDSASMRFNTSAANALLNFQSRPAGGTLVAFAQSFRFYLYVASSPALVQLVSAGSAAAAGTVLRLNSSGTLTIQDGQTNGSATSSLTISLNAWHRIDVDASGTT